MGKIKDMVPRRAIWVGLYAFSGLRNKVMRASWGLLDDSSLVEFINFLLFSCTWLLCTHVHTCTHTHTSFQIDWFFCSRNVTEENPWLNSEATGCPAGHAHLHQYPLSPEPAATYDPCAHRAPCPHPLSCTFLTFFLHLQGAVSVFWPHLEFSKVQGFFESLWNADFQD